MIARAERCSLRQLQKQINHDWRLDNYTNQPHIDKGKMRENQYLIGSPESCLSYFQSILNATQNKTDDALRLARRQKKKALEDDTNLATSLFFGISKANYDALKDKQKFMQDFTDSILNQLIKDYGKENIHSFAVHYDEPNAAPHIQAIIAPVATVTSTNRYGTKQKQVISHAALFVDKVTDMKKWRLSGETADKSKLGQFQTRYAECVKHLGVVRGTRNAWHKKHEPCRPPAPVDTPEVFPGLPPKQDKPVIPRKIAEWIDDQKGVLGNISAENAKQAAARAYKQGYNKALSDIAPDFEQYKDMANQTRDLKIRNGVLSKRLNDLKTTHEEQNRMQKAYFTKQQQMEIRSIPIKEVCFALGLIDRKAMKESKHDFISYDKTITIDIKKSDPYFWSDFKNGVIGKYGAIDLIMHVNSCSFTDAMQWAVDRFGTNAVLQDENRKAIQRNIDNIQKVQQLKPKPFNKPVKSTDSNDIERCKIYLAQRGLKEQIINQLINKGYVYPSKSGNFTNIIFCNSDCAAEVKGIGTGYKGLAPSSSRASSAFLLTGKEKPNSIMVFESALDLVAWWQEHPNIQDRILASVSGVGSNTEINWLINMCNEHNINHVISGYDNDDAGVKATETLKSALTEKGIFLEVESSPVGKDWCDAIEDKKLRNYKPKDGETLDQFLARYKALREKDKKTVYNPDIYTTVTPK